MDSGNVLFDILALLTAAVIAIPLFHRLGLGSVIGYLAAGAVLGPWGIAIIVDVTEIRHFSEFGVVFLMFLIGIEMKPARLWVMRHWVFGLGLAQVTFTAAILSGCAYFLSLPLKTAIIVGSGLALSSTAFGLQILSEKGELSSLTGRTAFSVLLFQDLAVVPLLTLIPLLAEGFAFKQGSEMTLIKAVLAVLFVVVSGRYFVNPLLNRIAASRNSEVFIAAAVLLVLGVARLMELVGISMALGAFLAGLMLAESHYRHQIEADIQPFRGILLGLFFMSVGMSINTTLLIEQFFLVIMLCLALLLIKIIVLWLLCWIKGINRHNALRVSILLSQAGEFGFVLFGYALIFGMLEDAHFQLLILVISMTMVTTPFLVKIGEFWIKRCEMGHDDSGLIEDILEENSGHVILAGFGRVGERIASLMDTAKVPYIALDNNYKQVMRSRNRGFSVYFGDARRMQVLKSVGASQAKMLIVSLDNVDNIDQLVTLARQQFPLLPIHARAKDRDHCKRLLTLGAKTVVSETLEASLKLSELVLLNSGFNSKQAQRLMNDSRQDYYGKIWDVVKKTDLNKLNQKNLDF